MKPPKRYDESSSSDDERNPPGNSSRRSGMRFSTIQEFLDSLNTATTAVEALNGLQQMSLESYQKCMQGRDLGAEDEDEGKGDAEPKRKSGEPEDIKVKDADD
ncbi:hypothetical protein KR044_001141 [Drosophila immigrans]|nr:hypothetical protein KR044_001141 [Drosophila immigrans]